MTPKQLDTHSEVLTQTLEEMLKLRLKLRKEVDASYVRDIILAVAISLLTILVIVK